MKFRELLCDVLDKLLIRDVINIIYTYSVRYDEPKYRNSYYQNGHNYEWLRCHAFDIDKTLYYCQKNVISVNDTNTIIDIDNLSFINVYYDKICVYSDTSNVLCVLDKGTFNILYKIVLGNKLLDCAFLTSDIIMVLHDDKYISFYDTKLISTREIDYQVNSISANHEYIFMINPKWNEEYQCADVYLLYFDHDLNFIKEEFMHYWEPYTNNQPQECLRVIFDNVIQISDDVFMHEYVMKEL